MGYNVIMSDIDVMWLADPLPFMLNQTEVGSMKGSIAQLSLHGSTCEGVLLYQRSPWLVRELAAGVPCRVAGVCQIIQLSCIIRVSQQTLLATGVLTDLQTQ